MILHIFWIMQLHSSILSTKISQTTAANFENILICYSRPKNKQQVFLFIGRKTFLGG